MRGRCDARGLAIVCKVLAALSGVVSETLVCRIQGPCEALVVILGGSETSDGCSFTWYRRERAVLTFLLTISTTNDAQFETHNYPGVSVVGKDI